MAASGQTLPRHNPFSPHPEEHRATRCVSKD
jgi:hypothetical protein